jgi:hypothetical protein
MHYLIILLLLLLILYLGFKPIQTKANLLNDLTTLKTHTVNLLNKILKTDTTKLIDFHIPDVHCNGLMDKILSPDELYKLSTTDLNLYKKLVLCGYTRTVGLLHGFALWSSLSKSKDLKSFQYFVDCVTKIQWNDPTLFIDFHSTKSKIGKCIV